MPRKKQLFYIASELIEDKKPMRKDTRKEVRNG